MKQLAIFDMDGLLINSEPLWERAEMSVFKEQGITITLEMCEKVKGFRVQETVAFYRKLFPEISEPTEFYVNKIVERLKILIANEGKMLPGVLHALSLCRNQNMKLAVASSSSMELIQFNLKKIGILNDFDLLVSGENETYGKPHPSIFLTVAQQMKMLPDNCIVFEDSLNGVIAGKAAKMKVIAVPEPKNTNNPKFVISDCLLHSLEELKMSDLC
ncbi:MAG: hexitol phosphatase HxpB [Bacteroidales bacterium]|nr:hexitol phosphatase HxpB [Bacteroidales bacterium]